MPTLQKIQLSSQQRAAFNEAFEKNDTRSLEVILNHLGLPFTKDAISTVRNSLINDSLENQEDSHEHTSHQPSLQQQAMQRDYLNRIERQRKEALESRDPKNLTKKEYREYQHLQRLEKSRQEIAENGPLSANEQKRYDYLSEKHKQYWQTTSREEAEEYNRLSAKINKAEKRMGDLRHFSEEISSAQANGENLFTKVGGKIKVIKSNASDTSWWLGNSKVLDDTGKEVLFSYQERPDSRVEQLTARELMKRNPKAYNEALKGYLKHTKLFRRVEDVQEFFTNPAKRKEVLLGNIHIRDKNGQDIMVTLEEERDALTQAEKDKLRDWRNNKSQKRSAAELAELRRLKLQEGKKIKIQDQVTLDSLRYTNPKLYRRKFREYIRESSPWYQWKKQFGNLRRGIMDPNVRNQFLKGFVLGDILVNSPEGKMYLQDFKKKYPRLYLKWLHEFKNTSGLFRFSRFVIKTKRRWKRNPELMRRDIKRWLLGTEFPKDFKFSWKQLGKNLTIIGKQKAGVFLEKNGLEHLAPYYKTPSGKIITIPEAINASKKSAPAQPASARKPSHPTTSSTSPQLRQKASSRKKNGSNISQFRFLLPFLTGIILFISSLTFLITLTNGRNMNNLPAYSGTSTQPAPNINYIPGQINTFVSTTTSQKEINQGAETAVINRIKNNSSLITMYQQAASITGIPWEILAGIHSREGGNNPNESLVDGAPWKGPIPDIHSCPASNKGKQGLPFPENGGCGFASELDTAIYAGNLLKDKNGGSVPNSFQQMVRAVSMYNGGGNRNNPSSEPFYGDSDPYAMNFYDSAHAKMDILYCGISSLCHPPVPDPNPGVMTVAKDVYYYIDL